MKKKIFAIAVIAICLSILASTTYAYYTRRDTAHNVITSNGVALEIQEWQENANGGWEEYPDETIPVMPKTEVSKIATVKNLGASSYVRARVEILFSDAEGTPMDHDPEVIALAMNEAGWSQKEGEEPDGFAWWYYSKPLGTGDVTDPLFTEVAFDGPSMNNDYQDSSVKVTVIAQAVQTAHNGETALDAAGWPAGSQE